MSKMTEDSCALVLIDWQERLFPAMPNEIRDVHLRNAQRLQWLFTELGSPLIVTEQYPKGLGKTLSCLQPVEAIEKTVFSAYDSISPILDAAPARKDIILSGMETHICVAQTALDLLESGYKPTLVIDACLSRKKLDWWCAIQRLMKEGVRLMTTEAVLFELIGRKEHRHFKELSKRIRNQ